MRLAVVTLVAGAALAVPAAPSHAAECAGVPVVVDFASLGGGVQTGCAPGDPSSGITALRSAGFEPTRAAQPPGYFVCRINGKPASDPCQRTSPADAYWSYWHGRPGGSWTYSGTGPADHDPEPGTVEGWAFGAGKPPSAKPPAKAARTPSAQPSVKPSPTRVEAAPTRAPARPVAAAANPAATPATAPAAAPTSRLASVASSQAPSPHLSPTASPALFSDDLSPPTVADPQPPNDGLPFAVGALVVGLLAAAGARQAWLRRNRG